MRESLSDPAERNGERCCISSDAEGRILTTSFPVFSHPISTRPVPGFFYHLDPHYSDNTGTAIAQVGRAISPVSPSQKAENSRWHNWLGPPSSPISSGIAVEGSKESLEHRASPGVSEIPRLRHEFAQSLPSVSSFLPRGSDRMVPKESQDINKLLSSSDTSQILSRYEGLVSRLRRLEEFDTPEPSNPPTEHAVKVLAEHPSTNSSEAHGEPTSSLNSGHIPNKGSAPIGPEYAGHSSEPASIIQLVQPETISAESSSSKSADGAQEACPTSDGTNPEAWKIFVFGDEGSEEVRRAAFQEANRAAIRSLKASDPPASSDDEPSSDGMSNAATVGTFYTRCEDGTPDSANAPSPTEATGSVDATYDPSLAETGSESVMDISDNAAQAPSVEVNAGNSSDSEAEVVVDSSKAGLPRSTEETGSTSSDSYAVSPTMTTSLAVAPPLSNVQSSETAPSGEQFRFVQPKLFVGSRSNLQQSTPVAEPRVGISLKRRRRGRPKKRANDGRANIRALPNYSSDPIEEFEEEARVSERLPPLLFPALELS
ncbi:hypothetical protein VTI74DRAFT_6935 [Chaetomium olivicolor]